jgi:hypothetical protein
MPRRYIDFISAYCDRWCERCAFTERCSQFAVSVAQTMCDGDFGAAIELAIGAPRVPGEQPQPTVEDRAGALLDGYEEPTARELEEIGREMAAREQRVDRHPLSHASIDYAVAAHRWLDARGDADSNAAALAIVRWDVYLIPAKIQRALEGRDEDPKGRFWRSRVQNDWNGSAKVARISVDRSERAWRSIAAGSGDEGATALADLLAAVRQHLDREFPRAMQFRRPGFDTEPNPSQLPDRQSPDIGQAGSAG